MFRHSLYKLDQNNVNNRVNLSVSVMLEKIFLLDVVCQRADTVCVLVCYY